MNSSFVSPISPRRRPLPAISASAIDRRLHDGQKRSIVQALIDRLGITEFRRRLFHVAPALFPLLLPFFEHRDVWGPILISLATLLIAGGLIGSILVRQFVLRPGEENWTFGVLGYAVPIVAPLIMFPGQAELGLMTLQIVALGDGSATLAGKLLRGKTLPWNRRKTFAGLISFCLAGTVAATYSYWGEAKPAVPLVTALVICATAAVAAGIAESLPLRSNDNLRVGTTALIAGALITLALV